MAARTKDGERYSPGEVHQAQVSFETNWNNDPKLLSGSIAMLRGWLELHPEAPEQEREQTARTIVKYVHLADVLGIDIEPMAQAVTR